MDVPDLPEDAWERIAENAAAGHVAAREEAWIRESRNHWGTILKRARHHPLSSRYWNYSANGALRHTPGRAPLRVVLCGFTHEAKRPLSRQPMMLPKKPSSVRRGSKLFSQISDSGNWSAGYEKVVGSGVGGKSLFVTGVYGEGLREFHVEFGTISDNMVVNQIESIRWSGQ